MLSYQALKTPAQGLPTVATLSDSTDSKVKSWRSPLMCLRIRVGLVAAKYRQTTLHVPSVAEALPMTTGEI